MSNVVGYTAVNLYTSFSCISKVFINIDLIQRIIDGLGLILCIDEQVPVNSFR